MTLRIACIIGSTRDGRMADRVIKLIKSQFNSELKDNACTLEVIDPLEYNLPLLKKPLHFYKDWSEASEELHKLNNIVKNSDAFLIITSEYNATLPPGLTNLIDHIPPPSFAYKPSGIVSYSMGTKGGTSAVAAARPFLAEIGCPAIKQSTMIATVHTEITPEGTTENKHVISSLGKLLKNLFWWGQATKAKRELDGTPE